MFRDLKCHMRSRCFITFIQLTFFTVSSYAVDNSVADAFAIPTAESDVYVQQFTVQSKGDFGVEPTSQLPTVTYLYLEKVFSNFYKKIVFSTTIADSTFHDTINSDQFSIPLIADNSRGIHLEIFGKFTDPTAQDLSNISPDHILYEYMTNTTNEIDFYQATFSMSAGFSFKTGENSEIKIIISNNEIPGYGDCNTLIGFETRF